MEQQIPTRALLAEDRLEVSGLLATAWKAAYKGLISEEYLLSLQNTHWVEFLKSKLTDRTIQGIVAEAEGGLVGTVLFGKSITASYPKDGEIIALYLLPPFIGNNIGHQLLTEAENALQQQGYSHCILCVFEENHKALQFYSSHHFEKVSNGETVPIGSQDLPYHILRKALRGKTMRNNSS